MPSPAGGVDQRDAPLRLWWRGPLAVQANYDACYYPIREGAAHLQPPWQPARPGHVTHCPAFVEPAAGGPWGSNHPHLQGTYPRMPSSHSACYQPSGWHAAPDQQWADGPPQRWYRGADQQSCHAQQPAEPFPQSAHHRTRGGFGQSRHLSGEPTIGQHASSAAKQQLQQFQQRHSSFGQLWPAPPATPAGHAASGPACSGISRSRSTQLASPASAASGSLCRQGSKPDASGGDQAFREPYHEPQKHKQHTSGPLGPGQPPQSPLQPEQPQPQQPDARKGPLSHRQRYRRKMYLKALEEQQQQEEQQRQQDAEQAALLATAAQFSLAAKQAKAAAMQDGMSAAASQEQAGSSQGSDCGSPVQQQKAGGQEHTEGTAALAAELTCTQLAPGKSQQQQVAASTKHWKLPDSLFDDDDAQATNDACGSSWRIPAVPAGGMVGCEPPLAWQHSADWCQVGFPRMAAGAAEGEADSSDIDQQLDEIDHHLTQLLGL